MNIPCDQQLLERIQQQGSIMGTEPSGAFGYHLDFSTPHIALAIHAGHTIREELLDFIQLAEDKRMFEEDTGTDYMVQGQPNAVWGLESRAVYDLNRDADMALPLVPEKFWGTRVYKKSPLPKMNERSLASHDTFYLFLGTLITHLLDSFGYCIVYDIHSYNISRQKAKGIESPPVFNLGTTLLNRSKWKHHIESWLETLSAISLPGVETTIAENEVFSGKGELCRRLCKWDSRILVLPTEVSKVYMDEIKGAIYPDIIKAIRKGLGHAMDLHLRSNSK